MDNTNLAILELIHAGETVANYREHLRGCDYDMTEFCTCGRKTAYTKWCAAVENAKKLVK